MKAHEFIVVALVLGALVSVLDLGGLIVFAMFVALATVCLLVHYFTTDRCPACQLPGALESTGEWRREPSRGFQEREKNEKQVQCKQCGHSWWRVVLPPIEDW